MENPLFSQKDVAIAYGRGVRVFFASDRRSERDAGK